MIRYLSAVLILLAGAAAAYANTGLYAVDPAASTIVFKARSTLHAIEGEAREFEGEFYFEPRQGTLTADGDIFIEVDSLASGNKKLDRNMHRMFESKEYPQMYCRVQNLRVTAPLALGEVPGKLHAVLTLRDISLPFETNVVVMEHQGGFQVRGSTAVSLKAFKLRPPTVLGVVRMADEVVVVFDITVKKR